MSKCVEWTGARNDKGYGIVWRDGRTYRAHRLAWIESVGPIPDGMLVLHKCDNPPCVLIEHLFLDTALGNTSDMIAKGRGNNQRKTHCIKGHPFDEENTRIDRRGHRVCRACHNEASAKYRAKGGE
jgi:hypothetical protein